jgi:hypothetical protein
MIGLIVRDVTASLGFYRRRSLTCVGCVLEIISVKQTAFAPIAEFEAPHPFPQTTTRRYNAKKIILKVLCFLVTAMSSGSADGIGGLSVCVSQTCCGSVCISVLT